MTTPVRVAAADEAAVAAELLVAWRDYMGRDWPDPGAIRAGVERLIVRDDAEYLLAGDPPAGSGLAPDEIARLGGLVIERTRADGVAAPNRSGRRDCT